MVQKQLRRQPQMWHLQSDDTLPLQTLHGTKDGLYIKDNNWEIKNEGNGLGFGEVVRF
jgi:hypothetical protein